MANVAAISSFLINLDAVAYVEILKRRGKDGGHAFAFEFTDGRSLAFGPNASGLKEAVRRLGVVDFDPADDRFGNTPSVWRTIHPDSEPKIFEF